MWEKYIPQSQVIFFADEQNFLRDCQVLLSCFAQKNNKRREHLLL